MKSREPSPTAPELSGADRDTELATAVKTLLASGDTDEARARFEELVSRQQRRASRIALHYLRDAAEADEAVQDAFVKTFLHLTRYREALPFEVWFTRILVNGCLDRLKARTRRDRWLVRLADRPSRDRPAPAWASPGRSPEEALLLRERRARLHAAIDRLPERQRLVLVLSQFDGRSTKEIGAMTGLNESTVRVHLFRAIRALRRLLGEERWLVERGGARAEREPR